MPTAAEFRAAAGQFATGVAVVTTRIDGNDHAMTANSFTSVSLDPMLVLVCVDKGTRFHEAILGAGTWVVSVLPAEAREAAVWFATKGRPLVGQLDQVDHHHRSGDGVAVLDRALAVLECTTWATYDGGDHTIVVGEVLALSLPNPEAPALGYFRGGYATLGEPTRVGTARITESKPAL